MTSCVVLFSGGIDSTTALYWCLRRYETVFPLSFDYGQRHRIDVCGLQEYSSFAGEHTDRWVSTPDFTSSRDNSIVSG